MEDQPFRVITRLRKSGNLQDAWDMGSTAVQENPKDVYLKGAFFWVCYDFLKQVQSPIKERALQSNRNIFPNSNELERINFLLDWVIWLDIPPGGFEYRSLLLLFQNNLECIPKLVLLLLRYSGNLFEEEDKIPYQGEKGESPSLMLKFVRKVAKAWLVYEELRQIDIDQLSRLFGQARKQVQDRQNLIWLDYDEAKCLVFSGRLESARELVISVLLKKQTESWAWGAFAATYVKESPDRAIPLFCKGLSYAHDEKFTLKIFKGLAPLLAASGHAAEASMCVHRAVNCYEDNGWKIKSDLVELTSQPWFDKEVDPLALSEFVDRMSNGAMDILHGPSAECVAIISSIHNSGKGFHAYRDHSNSYSVRLGLFKSEVKPKIGDYVCLMIVDEDNEVLSAKPCSAAAMDDVATEVGEIRVTDKGFGFVNDTFIPPYLIDEGFNGKQVSVTKVLDVDKKKNKLSWKAITLRVDSDL